MPRHNAAAAPRPGEVPHSWTLTKWPANVFPGTYADARNLLRFFRPELIKAKAITRVGRRIVVMGSAYDAWLKSRAGEVTEWVPPFARNKGKAA